MKDERAHAVTADAAALKREWRRTLLARRAQHGNAAAAHAVTRHVLGSFVFSAQDVVAGYVAIKSELDPAPLLQALYAQSVALALPALEASREALVFRRWAPSDKVVDGPYGIAQPKPEAAQVRPTVVLVPMLAFDKSGYRLGFGGGYYDRALRSLRAAAPVKAIGLAFAFQEVPALPHESHDEALDWVVTELGVRRFGTSAAL